MLYLAICSYSDFGLIVNSVFMLLKPLRFAGVFSYLRNMKNKAIILEGENATNFNKGVARRSIEMAIKTTLVVENKDSIDRAVDKAITSLETLGLLNL